MSTNIPGSGSGTERVSNGIFSAQSVLGIVSVIILDELLLLVVIVELVVLVLVIVGEWVRLVLVVTVEFVLFVVEIKALWGLRCWIEETSAAATSEGFECFTRDAFEADSGWRPKKALKLAVEPFECLFNPTEKFKTNFIRKDYQISFFLSILYK